MSKVDHVVLGAQCAAILSALNIGPRTSLQLRTASGSLCVTARVRDLRNAGFNIQTQLIQVPTRHHRRAHVALYTLRRRRGRPWKVRAKA
jgi:hypothetical protein